MGNAAVSACGATLARSNDVELRIGTADVAEVYLNVYDLNEDWLRTNSIFTDVLQIGGAFHAGVEVHGKEWTYGREGVSWGKPRSHEVHIYRDTVYMGATRYSEQELHNLIELELAQEWQGSDYDLLHRNCCSFADVLCRRLVGERLPGWVSRFPQVASAASRGFDKVINLDFEGSVSTSSAGGSDVIADRLDSADSDISEATETTVASAASSARSLSVADEDDASSIRVPRELSIADSLATGGAQDALTPTPRRTCPRPFIFPMESEVASVGSPMSQRPFSLEEPPANRGRAVVSPCALVVHRHNLEASPFKLVGAKDPGQRLAASPPPTPPPQQVELSDDEVEADGWRCA